MYELLQVLLAYVLADALTGLYHLVTDLGYNIPQQTRLFNNHHREPWTMTMDMQPVLGGIPLIILGFFVLPWLFIPLGIFVAVAQVPHYYAHHPERTPKWLNFLSKCHIVINPATHHMHHNSDRFDSYYCVLAGWNDWWLNMIGPWAQRFKIYHE